MAAGGPGGWRRPVRVLLAFAATLTVAVGLFSPGDATRAQSPDGRPNVVVVMTDDQTVEQMGAMRNVERLLRTQGTTFARSFAAYPLCCPSRATYLTGQYPHNHGVLQGGNYYTLDSTNTLPVWLQGAGYHTAHIGKYLNGYGTRDAMEVPPGWSEWQGLVDLPINPSAYNYYEYTLNENGTLVDYGPGKGAYQSDVYTRKAVEAIERRAPLATPFFLSVAYLAPHRGGPRTAGRCGSEAKPAVRHAGAFAQTPMPRPPSFDEADVSDKPAFVRELPRLPPRRREKLQRRWECRGESLLAVDEGVKAMVGALARAGELDNTLIVFTSDNGYLTGEHRLPDGKIHHYEESSRVPLVVRGPGFPAGRKVSDLVANIDLAPTIVDAARATPRRLMDGRPLGPLARSPRDPRGREILLEHRPGSSERPPYFALRAPRYKYVEYESGERELYDLERDRYEQRSRHADPRYRIARRALARRLEELRRCAADSCR